MMGNVQLATTEEKRIVIGQDTLFSDDIWVRTGDSHSIVDAVGKRINDGEDVEIGNHVWVGNRVTVLKGAHLGNHCVVGSGSVVTKSFPDHTVVAGNPAKVIKEGVDWKFERI